MKKSIFILSAILILLFSGIGYPIEEVKPFPKYLIVLVHGINTSRGIFLGHGENGSILDPNDEKPEKSFGDLKGYLENNLGLNGYVYAYTFSQRDGSIALEGKEVGDRSYHNKAGDEIDGGGRLNYLHGTHKQIPSYATKIAKNSGNCWFEQAREDFKSDFFKKYKRDPTEEEIPKKYILIAHSMGGLAAREYIFSDYYQNDVAALITIDTPHEGASSATALKKIKEFYTSGEYMLPFGGTFYAAICAGIAGNDYLCGYLASSAFLLASTGGIFYEWFSESQLGQYDAQPAVRDMDPNNPYIASLSSKRLKEGSDPIKVKIIAAKGVPTPSGSNINPFYQYVWGLSAAEVLFSSDFWNDLSGTGKVMALYLNSIAGGQISKTGDFMVEYNSQLGKNVESFNDSRIEVKRWNHTYPGSSDDVGAMMSTAVTAGLTIQYLSGGNPWTRILTIALMGGNIAAYVAANKEGYLYAHGLAMEDVVEKGILLQALSEIPRVGGNIPDNSSPYGGGGIITFNVNSNPFKAPEQIFSLYSNLDNKGKDTGMYNLITIEAYTPAGSNSSQSFPITKDGGKHFVSGITVKKPPTMLKGVINEFLPQKMQYFQYSENFAAWKDINIEDNWGNFLIKNMRLAEGNNVIAFRTKNLAGNESSQILNITLNTIPCLPSKFYPAPNSFTNNPKQKVGAEFTKSKYAEKSAGFKVLTCEIDGIAVPYAITTGESTYDEWCRIEAVPAEPLADGEHRVLIRVQTDVGLSQALWAYTVDTTPPSITIQPIKPISLRELTKEE